MVLPEREAENAVLGTLWARRRIDALMRRMVPGEQEPLVHEVTETALAFRLYQPLHMRFYVLTASLTCRVPGQPDHTIKPDEGETITYVIRRVEALSTQAR